MSSRVSCSEQLRNPGERGQVIVSAEIAAVAENAAVGVQV